MNSYDVRIWEIKRRVIRGKSWYRVRWAVENEPFEQLFERRALAVNFRDEMASASRAGDPFDVATGRPVAHARQRIGVTWYEHARDYVAMKWPRVSANHRRGIVEAITAATIVLVRPMRGRPDDKVLRAAIGRWALDPKNADADPPEVYAAALAWLERAALPVVELDAPSTVRRVLDAFCVNFKTKRAAAAATVQRKRAIFYNAVEYAVEREYLAGNPIDRLAWSAPDVAQAIDRRVVANPAQVEALLGAVASLGNRADRVTAFFGCLYYAGMRPSEAGSLRRADCELPAEGWGLVTLSDTDPYAGRRWTNDGEPYDRRGLKHRARSETRTVSIPPALVELLRQHQKTHGLAPDGRFFRGLHGGPLPSSIYQRWWRLAREEALTDDQQASPLAKRPYDLRHAAASLWLNAGVPPTEVARRLGHSVAVLLKVYANCIHGDAEQQNAKIENALGGNNGNTTGTTPAEGVEQQEETPGEEAA